MVIEKLANNLLTITDKPIKNISIIPNPTSNTSTFNFQLINDEQVSIGIYNLSGQQVLMIKNNISFKRGNHSINFDINSLKQGLYMMVLSTNSFTETEKLTVIK